MGQEEPFPPTRLSVGCGFRKGRLGGMKSGSRGEGSWTEHDKLPVFIRHVLGLLVTPRRRTSEERAQGLRPPQMQWAAILGGRVLEPHFDRRCGASHLSVMPNSGRATPTDRVIAGVVSTTP
jgi:hypothetical protein